MTAYNEWDIAGNKERKRHPEDATTKLERWVYAQGGTYKAAQMIGCHQISIYSWLRRKTTPPLGIARSIVKASKGALTYEDIYKDTAKQ